MKVDWQTIRKTGQLQILNRTSLVLLAVVPVMAAFWTQAALYTGLENIFPKFPQVMALLFFAAVAIVLARLLFQIGCPEIVANETEAEYVASQKLAYELHPTSDPLDRAIEYLEQRELARNLVEVENENRLRWTFEVGQTELAIANQARQLHALQKEDTSLSATTINIHVGQIQLASLRKTRREIEEKYLGRSGAIFIQRLSLVELAAKERYAEEAGRKMTLVVVTLLLYVTAVVLVLWAVFIQAWAVARATGWVGANFLGTSIAKTESVL
jgi:hypothetical protein